MAIDLLVIHNISLPAGQFGGNEVVDFFQNRLDLTLHPTFKSLKDLKVSAHLLIRRGGDIIQFVPFHLRAWHAGKSVHMGRTDCNDFSIGIELEGTDEILYTDEQYYQLTLVAAALVKQYPSITLDRIVGHQTIAPTRKTDPGPSFDWKQFLHSLEKEVQNETNHPITLHTSPNH